MGKKLVTYFSASGVTANAANILAEAVSADVCEIKPEVLYTKEDLDYMNPESRSSVEMKDCTSRPAIVKGDLDMAAYDTVFVGFPIWWGTAPTIIHTFLKAYDMTDKKIVVFATSGGSPMGKTIENISKFAPSATYIDGGVVKPTASKEELINWIQSL